MKNFLYRPATGVDMMLAISLLGALLHWLI